MRRVSPAFGLTGVHTPKWIGMADACPAISLVSLVIAVPLPLPACSTLGVPLRQAQGGSNPQTEE